MKLFQHIVIASTIACVATNAKICAAEIHGMVIDGETHTPLTDTSLRIQDSNDGAIINVDGHFTLTAPLPGEYEMKLCT